MEEWTAVHHGVYPAYISWEQFLANKQRLHQNGYRLAENTRGAPRKGPALLAGLVLCGHCGRRMGVVYGGSKGKGGYVCTALPSTHGARSCLYAPRVNTDEAVVEAVVEAIRPSELDLLEETLKTQSADRERLLVHHRDNVKAATYEARLAEKRYRSVDPENRLVAGELEKGWESALRTLAEAEEAAERFERERPQVELDPTLRTQLSDLGRHLPELWDGG
nr:recombinase zinc beta ribbon domain-containing protein [Rubrobacteraceae bacterium]